MKNKILLPFILVLMSTSCVQKQWIVSESTSVKIPIDSTADKIADKAYTEWLQPYKQKVDAQMNEVIGYSAVTMRAAWIPPLLP